MPVSSLQPTGLLCLAEENEVKMDHTCRRSATAMVCLPALLNAALRLTSTLGALQSVSRRSVYSLIAVSASPLSKASAALQSSGGQKRLLSWACGLESQSHNLEAKFKQNFLFAIQWYQTSPPNLVDVYVAPLLAWHRYFKLSGVCPRQSLT